MDRDVSMIIKPLSELQEPDAASLVFSPSASGRLSAADTARWQQEAVARYEVSAQVPETTRLSFERVRTIYAYGVLCYELYTVAGDQALLAVEQALRDRFLPFYNETVPFADGQGGAQSINAASYQDFFDQLRGKPKSWKLQPVSGKAAFRFNGMLASLLRWARAENLLAGQRDRLRDRPRVSLRNFTAHGTYRLDMPGSAERAIADLSEIINRIWGAPSGEPLEREIVIIAWDQRGVIWGRAEGFELGPLDGPETCVVVRAARLEQLADYDSLYEAVTSPCEYLWGPGTLAEAEEWVNAHQPEGDQVQILDRLFALRYHNSLLHLPQSLTVAAGLDPAHSAGKWYLIRADSPADAFSHQRQLLAGIDGHNEAGQCHCPVETVGEGSLREVLALASAAGANTVPMHVPDARVTISGTPRCNRILTGSWDIPPDDPFMARFAAGQA
jgi:hypothetical protein